MCLLVSILFLGPRAGIIVYWLGWPTAWDEAFSHFLVPLIGFIAFPWTILMYVLVAPDGVGGWDYLLLALAIAIDMASLASQAGVGRSRATAPSSAAAP